MPNGKLRGAIARRFRAPDDLIKDNSKQVRRIEKRDARQVALDELEYYEPESYDDHDYDDHFEYEWEIDFENYDEDLGPIYLEDYRDNRDDADFEAWLGDRKGEWELYGPGGDSDVEYLIRKAYQMGKES